MSDIIPTEEVDDTSLGHDQLGDIKQYLSTLGRTNVTELGQALGLRYTTLRDLPQSGFLDQVMTLWLDEAEDVLKKGKPSWRSLVQGLRDKLVRQNGIANKIAKEHRTQEVKNAKPQKTGQITGERPEVAAPHPPGRTVIDSDEPSRNFCQTCIWISTGLVLVLAIVSAIFWGPGLFTTAQLPAGPSQSVPSPSSNHHPPPSTASPAISPSPDKNCQRITRKPDLYTELAEIGNWEALCTHLEVPEATLDGLVHAHLENTAKKQRCLAAYIDQENACWEKVVEVVAGYPFYKKNLAKQIAEKYGVTWQE